MTTLLSLVAQILASRAYCLLTSWLNPVLDRLDLWRRLERLIGVS